MVTPVAVSLWTMQMALMVWAWSWASFSARTSRLAPWPQSLSTTSTLNLRRCCWSIQRRLNCPMTKLTIRSPGERVFVSALSHAPVPAFEQGEIWIKKMSNWWVKQMDEREIERGHLDLIRANTVHWNSCLSVNEPTVQVGNGSF